MAERDGREGWQRGQRMTEAEEGRGLEDGREDGREWQRGCQRMAGRERWQRDWFYALGGEGNMEVLKYGGGHVTATKQNDGHFKQTNGTVIEITPFSIKYSVCSF